MASRKLKVEEVKITSDYLIEGKGPEVTRVSIAFSRKLTPLEIRGVCAVLDGSILK